MDESWKNQTLENLKKINADLRLLVDQHITLKEKIAKALVELKNIAAWQSGFYDNESNDEAQHLADRVQDVVEELEKA